MIIPGIDTIGFGELPDRVHEVDAFIDVLPKRRKKTVKDMVCAKYPQLRCFDIDSLIFYISEL